MPTRTHRKRLRLVLYSGGQERRNAQIHERLLEIAPRRSRRGIRMSYVPFCAEGADVFFRRFVRRYRSFGASHFECLPLDGARGRGARELGKRLLASDVVYLAGGNTFTFLHHVRASGMLSVLRRFAANGGLLAGLSAGALLMTPHIGLAGYPDFDRDENEVGLRDLRALDLVPFEFFPHYRASARYRDAMLRYSRRSELPLYACRDGSGLVVEGDRFTAHGDVWLFDRGRERKLPG